VELSAGAVGVFSDVSLVRRVRSFPPVPRVDDPTELPRALIFLGAAMTIVWSAQYSKAPTDRQ
jgi:hypothetical protein